MTKRSTHYPLPERAAADRESVLPEGKDVEGSFRAGTPKEFIYDSGRCSRVVPVTGQRFQFEAVFEVVCKSV